jgi:putative FmdB family regulatory protein
MPIYEYKCENGHVFDVMQKIADEPLSTCRQCGAPAQRVLHPVAVHFKGSGFYNTDYGKRKGAAAGSDGAKDSQEPKGADSGASKSDSTDASSGDSKATAATTGDQ